MEPIFVLPLSVRRLPHVTVTHVIGFQSIDNSVSRYGCSISLLRMRIKICQIINTHFYNQIVNWDSQIIGYNIISPPMFSMETDGEGTIIACNVIAEIIYNSG